MKTYYFIRHGASTADSGEIQLQGVNAPATVEDIPLSKLGRREAGRAAEFFESLGTIEAVYSSPLSRTYDTAAIIAERLGLNVQLLPEIKEVDVSGLLDFAKKFSVNSSIKASPGDVPLNVYQALLMATGNAFFAAWRVLGRIPNTEPPAEVKRRLERAFSILDAAPEQRIVVVSHGYLISYLATYMIGNNPFELLSLRRMWVRNCSVTKITTQTQGKLRLRYFGRADYENIS